MRESSSKTVYRDNVTAVLKLWEVLAWKLGN